MQCPAGRVFQYRVRSGRVLDKIPGSGSGSVGFGSGRSVEIYDRVFPVIIFTLGYVGYFRVFLGLPTYSQVIFKHLLRLKDCNKTKLA